MVGRCITDGADVDSGPSDTGGGQIGGGRARGAGDGLTVSATDWYISLTHCKTTEADRLIGIMFANGDNLGTRARGEDGAVGNGPGLRRAKLTGDRLSVSKRSLS